MKTDARIKYTKKIIKEALLFLLDKNPPDKITVTGICEYAEINRSTFYKYYTDPYDLIARLEEETLEELNNLAGSSNGKTIDSILLLILSEIREKKPYYYRLFYKQDIHAFNEKVMLLCCQAAYPQITPGKQFPSLKEKEWFYYFIIQGSSYILDRWVRDGMPDQITQIAGFLRKMQGELLRN